LSAPGKDFIWQSCLDKKLLLPHRAFATEFSLTSQ
jgi:hypothetical protein